MSADISLYQSGLVIFGTHRFDIKKIEETITEALSIKGHKKNESFYFSDNELSVLTPSLIVQAKSNYVTGTDDDYRVKLTVRNRDDAGAGLKDISLKILAMVTALLSRTLQASSVYWLDAKDPIPAHRFRDALNPIRPRRVTVPNDVRRSVRPITQEQHKALYMPYEEVIKRPNRQVINQAMSWTVQQDQSNIMSAFTNQGPDSLPLRLTTFVLTAILAFFSAPIAASMLVYNIFRNTGFRPTAYALCITALIVAVQQTGLDHSLFNSAFS